MQVAYLEAFLHIDQLTARDSASFLTWLTRIAENALRDAVRGLSRQKRPDPARRVVPASGADSYVGLLDRIEKEMPKAKPEVQWTMNNTLGAIGIHHAKHRKRAIAIGEKIGLYRDWPVSKGCTPPYVPVWVEAMVKRKG